MTVVDRINERFRNGVASNDLQEAGILIHQFDSLDDVNPSGEPWRPYKGNMQGLRISASMVNGHMQPDPPYGDSHAGGNIPVYSWGLAGLVLAPDVNRLACGYSYDVGSLGRDCDPKTQEGCLPGCSNGPQPVWCAEGTAPEDTGAPCAWAASSLKACMEGRDSLAIRGLKPKHKKWDDHKYYSELILNADAYLSNLPASIEAVFFLRGMDCADVYDGPKCEPYARKAHAAILDHFSMSPNQLPLLSLDLWNWDRPFEDINPNPMPPGLSISGQTANRAAGGQSCTHKLCTEFDSWFTNLDGDGARRFFSMWGSAYQRRDRHSDGCYAWQGGSAKRFFAQTLSGKTCDRNWLEGAIGNAGDRPFEAMSPALLGFDESINEECSRLLGMEPWDNGDLNWKIADRCRRAKRNVLRLLTGGWTMCQNLEWQMCALQGLLPGQGTRRISFATAPADLRLEWWENPSTHPTFPCRDGRCDPNGFTVGDVFFAEVAITYLVCANRASLFSLAAGDFFTCELDERAFNNLNSLLTSW